LAIPSDSHYDLGQRAPLCPAPGRASAPSRADDFLSPLARAKGNMKSSARDGATRPIQVILRIVGSALWVQPVQLKRGKGTRAISTAIPEQNWTINVHPYSDFPCIIPMDSSGDLFFTCSGELWRTRSDLLSAPFREMALSACNPRPQNSFSARAGSLRPPTPSAGESATT
jgi:hypothetical protein